MRGLSGRDGEWFSSGAFENLMKALAELPGPRSQLLVSPFFQACTSCESANGCVRHGEMVEGAGYMLKGLERFASCICNGDVSLMELGRDAIHSVHANTDTAFDHDRV